MVQLNFMELMQKKDELEHKKARDFAQMAERNRELALREEEAQVKAATAGMKQKHDFVAAERDRNAQMAMTALKGLQAEKVARIKGKNGV